MNSIYLKQQIRANERLSLILSRTFDSIGSDFRQTISDIRAGSERLTYYGSCLSSDDYFHSACNETFKEDSRLAISLKQIYKRDDVILDMVSIYFKQKINLLSEEKSSNLSERLVAIIGSSAHYATGKLNKTSLATLVAVVATGSSEFKNNSFKVIKGFTSGFITATSLYARAQVAALAARKLQMMDKEYYSALYQQNVEMLYFLIEPSMSKIIYQIKSGDNKEDVILDSIINLFKK